MNENEIFQQLCGILVEEFELEPANITREAHLYEDLDLDSIDAVDLVIRLQQMTGKKIMPDEFKGVRTVGDVTRCVEQLFKA